MVEDTLTSRKSFPEENRVAVKEWVIYFPYVPCLEYGLHKLYFTCEHIHCTCFKWIYVLWVLNTALSASPWGIQFNKLIFCIDNKNKQLTNFRAHTFFFYWIFLLSKIDRYVHMYPKASRLVLEHAVSKMKIFLILKNWI